MSTDFLDSNILIYAYAQDAPEKRNIARGLLRASARVGMTVSSQVLAEFSNALLHKLRMDPAKVMRELHALDDLHLITPDRSVVQRAIEAHARYGIHFYDGMIVAAAERAGCARIWSEDLNSKQSYFGVRVENPF